MSKVSLGDVIFVAVKPIIKIYLIIFVGWLMVKYNLLTMETSRGLSNMVVNALLPSLVFNKIVTNLSGSQIKEIGVAVLTAIVMFSTGGFLAFVASYITPVPKKWRNGLIFGGIFGNISDLPIAYIQSMGTGLIFTSAEADKGVALSCIFLAVQSFMMMNLGMFQIVGLDFKDDVEDEIVEEHKIDSDDDRDRNGIENSHEVRQAASTTDPDFVVAPLFPETLSDDDLESQIPIRRNHTITSSFRRVHTHGSAYSSRSQATQRKQDIQSVINEYSEADALRSTTIDQLAKTISRTQEVGLRLDDSQDLDSIFSGEKSVKPSKWNKFIEKHKLGWLDYVLMNFIRVPSLSLLIALTVAMVPWLRALFVHNSINIREAPDSLPVLNFVMDFCSYVGNAAIPMGLLLLGGTIARLQIQEIPKGFWKTLVFMIPCRLVIMPIFGILWANRLYSNGWIEDDISKFVLSVTWAVPSATAQVYFTAFYTPLEGEHIQMDCLAIFLVCQYPVLIITLAIVVSYVLKVSIGV